MPLIFFEKAKELPWLRLLKFSITGGSALLIDVSIYFFLTRFFNVPYLASRAFSIFVAIFWNFMLNRHWTFQATEGKMTRQLAKFFVVIILTSIANLVFMKIGVQYFHLNDLLVIFVISGLILLINFSAHYFWSYA